MRFDGYSVSGFRSLAHVSEIPLRCPTILTGRNDSGKSAALAALAFFLGDHQIGDGDYRRNSSPDGEAVYEPVCVTGRFTLLTDEQTELGLPQTVEIKRTATRGSARAPYEVLRPSPDDLRLRDLETLSLTQLKGRATELDIPPDGPANAKESFLRTLRTAASQGPQVMAWVQADAELVARLPKYLYLSGADGVDTRAQLLAALKFTYRGILARDTFTTQVEGLQAATEAELAGEIDALNELIEKRCDGLSEVSIKPQVSFRDALSGVQVIAKRDGVEVDFEQVGAGRRRQLVQAIWEWSNAQLAEATEQRGAAVVLAYDEPDTHLDYVRQRNFMDLVREQCMSAQVRSIVATHSVQMIDQVPLEDVVHLELVEGRTALHRLPEAETEDALGGFIGQLAEELGLSTSSVLFERCFLLVEGESEKVALPRLFKLITGRRMQEAGIVPFDSGGNATVLKLVAHLHGMGKPVYVLVDEDSKTNQAKTFTPENLQRNGVPPERIDYLGDPNELEELFSDGQWALTADRFWPRTDEHPWKAGQIEALRGGGKFSDLLVALFERHSGERIRKPHLVARLSETLTHRDEVPGQLVKAVERIAGFTAG